MKLAIVILNWNAAVLTQQCVCSARAAIATLVSETAIELIVVDNGSDVPFKETPAVNEPPESPQLTVIRSEQNLGFAAGMNLGIAAAMRGQPNYIWLLNNDTRIEANALNALIAYVQRNPEKKCIGSTIIDDATGDIETLGGYRYWASLSLATPIQRKATSHTPASDGLSLYKQKQPLSPNTVVPDYICGSAMLLRAEIIDQLGGLPTTNFLYFEELNLTAAIGGRDSLGVCLESQVRHQGGASTRHLPNQARTYYATLAALRYTASNHPYYMLSVIAARTTMGLWRALRRGDRNHITATAKAISDFILPR